MGTREYAVEAVIRYRILAPEDRDPKEVALDILHNQSYALVCGADSVEIVYVGLASGDTQNGDT